jgi:hypothetical protein
MKAYIEINNKHYHSDGTLSLKNGKLYVNGKFIDSIENHSPGTVLYLSEDGKILPDSKITLDMVPPESGYNDQVPYTMIIAFIVLMFVFVVVFFSVL